MNGQSELKGNHFFENSVIWPVVPRINLETQRFWFVFVTISMYQLQDLNCK